MLIPTPTSGDLSLYFHLPFCTKKCDYCHFFVLPNKVQYKKMLLEALLIEIEERSTQIMSSSIQSIYFGGGTPALVGARYIQTLLKKIEAITSIDNIEITLELNPENHSYDELKAYFDVGVNRLSVGAQSFDDEELKALSRTHCSEEISKAICQAHRAGFENITLDLIYDLPSQTLESWTKSCKRACELPIQHISLYNLTIERETVFHKYRSEIEKKMPPSTVSLSLFEIAKSIFKEHGFLPYEISAFCKDDHYSRHNVGYWMQRNHLGFGPSAFSLFDKKRFMNVKNLKRYHEDLSHRRFPISYSEELESDAFLRESLIIALRLYQGIDETLFQKRFGVFSKELLKKLSELEDKQWVIKDSGRIYLTDLGRQFHDTLAEEIV